MFLFSKLKDDPLLSKVLHSSGALFSANTISLALSVVQSILAARLLGPAGFGLVAIITSYTSTINGFLSFRMSELVVRYGGEYLEKDEKGKTSALIKAAALSEATVSLLAFLFVAITATLASQFIAKTPNTALLFIVYSFVLLANFNTETSTGVLQMLGKIKYQGVINLVQSIVTAGLITFAFFTKGSVQFVLYAYLAGKVVLGFGIFFTAFFQLTKKLGRDWWREPVLSSTWWSSSSERSSRRAYRDPARSNLLVTTCSNYGRVLAISNALDVSSPVPLMAYTMPSLTHKSAYSGE